MHSIYSQPGKGGQHMPHRATWTGVTLGNPVDNWGVGVWLYSDKRLGEPPISSGRCDWLARIIPQAGIRVKHATQR